MNVSYTLLLTSSLASGPTQYRPPGHFYVTPLPVFVHATSCCVKQTDTVCLPTFPFKYKVTKYTGYIHLAFCSKRASEMTQQTQNQQGAWLLWVRGWIGLCRHQMTFPLRQKEEGFLNPFLYSSGKNGRSILTFLCLSWEVCCMWMPPIRNIFFILIVLIKVEERRVVFGHFGLPSTWQKILSLANAQEMFMKWEWSCEHSEVFNIGQCKQTSIYNFVVSPVTVHFMV